MGEVLGKYHLDFPPSFSFHLALNVMGITGQINFIRWIVV